MLSRQTSTPTSMYVQLVASSELKTPEQQIETKALPEKVTALQVRQSCLAQFIPSGEVKIPSSPAATNKLLPYVTACRPKVYLSWGSRSMRLYTLSLHDAGEA